MSSSKLEDQINLILARQWNKATSKAVAAVTDLLQRPCSDADLIRAQSGEMLPALAALLQTVTDGRDKTDVFYCMIWMFNPKNSADDETLHHLLSFVPLFKDEYLQHAQQDATRKYAGEILNGLSNVVSYVGREAVQAEFEQSQIVDMILPALRSNSVESNSISAALLVANLIGHKEESADIIQHAIPQMLRVVAASINRSDFGGRKWNPKGACKALANISKADANKRMLYSLGTVRWMVAVLNFDWTRTSSYDSLGAGYFSEARQCCAKVLWNIAFECDFLPDEGVEEALRKLAADQTVTQSARDSASGALFYLRQKRNLAAREDPPPGYEAAMSSDTSTAAAVAAASAASAAAASAAAAAAALGDDDVLRRLQTAETALSRIELYLTDQVIESTDPFVQRLVSSIETRIQAAVEQRVSAVLQSQIQAAVDRGIQAAIDQRVAAAVEAAVETRCRDMERRIAAKLGVESDV